MVAASCSVVRAGGDALVLWAERSGHRRVSELRRGGLRFAFYGRVSTEDYQDPVSSRARQLDQAAALVAGFGLIVAEFFDVGQSRELAWVRRPQAAALLAALSDPHCPFDAIVIGEYERAFYGSQYAAMAPLFEHYGVQLWMPEAGGRVNFAAESDEQLMLALGVQSKARDHPHPHPGAHCDGRPGPLPGPLPRRPATVWVPAGGCGPAPEQGARRVGQAGPAAGTRPADRAGGAVDVRAAAGRAQPGPDHPGAQRRGHPLPVGRRPGT